MTPIRTKILISLVAVAMLLIGCSKDPKTTAGTGDIQLSLNLDGIASFTPANTKATVVESAISNLWVLQFKMAAGSTTEGVLVGRNYFSAVSDPTKVQFKCIAGENMAFLVVANTADANLFKSLAIGTSGASLVSVKAMTIPITATSGTGLPSDASTNLPMIGQSANIATLPISTLIPITLTRLVSKIVLTVKNPFEAGYPQLKIQQVQLKRIPKLYSIQLIQAANFDGSTDAKRYPAAATANFIDYTPVVGNITAAGTNYLWYLAPNARGASTNTDDRLKSDATAPTGQGDYCSYIEITATAQADATAPTVDVRYRLYLGANNTNDFNLHSNTVYKVGIELTGINGNDARMIITSDKFDLVQGGSDGDHSQDMEGWELYESYFTETEADAPFIISPRWLEADRLWQTTPSPTGITDAFDGKGNTAKLLAIPPPNDSPAAKYCRSLGADWYIPSQAQLMLMWVYKDAIPMAEQSIRNNSPYWSSTALNNHAWYIDFSNNGLSSSIDKGNSYYVRCVRETSAQAQIWKYPKVEGGNTIVSSDAAGGIKGDALLTTAQKTWLLNTNTSTTTYNEQSEYNRVSAKFQVASTDASTSSTWAEAYALCKSYSQTGTTAGSWRLPTQRELMLIWVLRSQLTGCGTLPGVNFWSSTEVSIDTGIAWAAGFVYGGVGNVGKGGSSYVRCVRDL